ncbi:MAG: hypothetical protein WDN28_26340 [Chthoniobacter sp.]
MQLEMLVVVGSGLMSWMSGRSALLAVSRAPVTRPSTCPYCTIMAPK